VILNSLCCRDIRKEAAPGIITDSDAASFSWKSKIINRKFLLGKRNFIMRQPRFQLRHHQKDDRTYDKSFDDIERQNTSQY
jgi:hypothetical protein